MQYIKIRSLALFIVPEMAFYVSGGILNVTYSLTCYFVLIVISRNSTWLVTSRHNTDTFDVSSPCILAVSSLSNSTARRVRHTRLDSLDKLNVSSRVET